MLDILEKQGDDHIAGWNPNGVSFTIKKPGELVRKIMPYYFNQTKYKSFQRQLNIYGFKRILLAGECKGSYFHKDFVKSKYLSTHRIQRKQQASERSVVQERNASKDAVQSSDKRSYDSPEVIVSSIQKPIKKTSSTRGGITIDDGLQKISSRNSMIPQSHHVTMLTNQRSPYCNNLISASTLQAYSSCVNPAGTQSQCSPLTYASTISPVSPACSQQEDSSHENYLESRAAPGGVLMINDEQTMLEDGDEIVGYIDSSKDDESTISPKSPVCSQQEDSSDETYWASRAAGGALMISDQQAMLELDIISAGGDESVTSIDSVDEDFLAGASIDFFDECPKVIYINCKSI
jgi:hypothetical protein